MSTIRQKKLATALIENLEAKDPLNKEKLVASVGYSTKVAEHKATEILESKGVKEELAIAGFTEENAKSVVSEILLAGDSDQARLKAADMIFQVLGSYAPQKQVNVNISTNTDDAALDEAARLYGESVAKRKLA